AVLRVRDSGMGMDEETLPRIFDPFFTTKPMGTGTGLGLSMVYGFVQQSGGAITAHSKPGAGTTFEIYLPLVAAEAPATAPTTPSSVAPAARGELVLVVDDAPQVRAIAARALRGMGYSVLEAHGGAEALRVFDEHRSDIALVLTDVAMPGMSGRALADALHALARTLPVLFMSGYAEDAVLREGPQAARERFLAKPFTPDRLAAAVRALLDLPA
ncbi:MAG: response regulator, partial [Deltaproteobacteria bacterium]|nr:response regulator [Deltaproteobacteria bacterium]